MSSKVKEEPVPDDGCDVSNQIPPSLENPLPPFGEIFRKRHEQILNAGPDDPAERKRRVCQEEPLKTSCIPKEIVLPFIVPPETVGRYLEADVELGAGPTNLMKSVRVVKGKTEFPGWLVELTDPQLRSLVDAKKVLASGKSFCEIFDPFYEALSGLGATITQDEVKEILRRVPHTSTGWSFSHFMFIAGNPAYARKKGILQEPLAAELAECSQGGEEGSPSASKTGVEKKKKNVVERLYQLPTIGSTDPWPAKGEKKEPADDTGYSIKEKLFYSGLLYCEMYETIQAVERMYVQGETIAEPRDKYLKRQQRAGFGVSAIGTRKLGFAEWDRPLPPLPKISPYISDFPLVGLRRKIIKPNGDVAMYKRSRSNLRPLFLAVQAPQKPKDTIKVMASEQRVKNILSLLASQGNCMAMLPNVHCLIHLSDTLLSKIEEVHYQKGPTPPKIYRNNDMSWITKEAKNLFRPHGLPAQIARIPGMITFTDGLKLREICKQVRDQHWSYICLRRGQFRETVWKLMHVDRIPCGNLRESFVYAFQALLPPKAHLPIIRDCPLPW